LMPATFHFAMRFPSRSSNRVYQTRGRIAASARRYCGED